MLSSSEIKGLNAFLLTLKEDNRAKEMNESILSREMNGAKQTLILVELYRFFHKIRSMKIDVFLAFLPKSS